MWGDGGSVVGILRVCPGGVPLGYGCDALLNVTSADKFPVITAPNVRLGDTPWPPASI